VRANSCDRKGFIGVYADYEIKGLNLDRFINTVKKRGITLYNVKKQSNKCVYITVSYQDDPKFFAIGKELCYNIKKIREKGKGYFLLKLVRSIGLVFGAIIFVCLAMLANDTVFSVEFSGSGSIYKHDVEQYMYEQGVKPMARFSSFNLEVIEDGILAQNPHLSFVSCIKHGSKINVNLVLATDKVETLSGKVYKMYAPLDGQIESIKVYRGTAIKGVGETVKKGDIIVDGYAMVKDQKVELNVLACVCMKVPKTFIYSSESDNDQENAQLFALGQLEDKEIISCSVQKTKDGEKYIYQVTAYYRMVIYAG